MKKVAVWAMLALALAACGKKPHPDVKVGDTAPEFTVFTLDSLPADVVRSGNVTMLLFFATWCPHCDAELPQMQEIYNALKGSARFALAAVAREQPAEVVKRYWKDKGYTMPVYLDEQREVFSLFAEKGIPRFYLLDENRVVRHLHVGTFDTPEALDSIKVCLNDLLK